MSQRPLGYSDVRIEDVDAAIVRWFDKVVDAHVNFPDGRRTKVPVILSAKERWVSSRENAAVRDKDGRTILPVLSITRTALDPTNGMLALGSNVPRLQISRQVAGKTRTLVTNHEEQQREMLSTDPKPVVYEVTTIPFPFNGTAQYKFMIHTQYMTHMNEIIERIMCELEFFDVPCFVAPILGEVRPEGVGQAGEREPYEESPYDLREPLEGPYVCGYLEEAMGSEGNLDEFTDQERIFRYSGGFTVPVALLLNPAGKRESVQREYTSFRVDFGRESSQVIDDPDEIELIFGGGKISEKVRRR